ncbi:MAG TPA: nicotinate-nucleotide adenylyltransferase [Thermoleophilia bacterium]|nr:nicotinate-nucleotide adenylyltransferase [Thermoleophilia bacterium]
MAATLARVGVMGGTFDPPHLAHLAIASDACARLGLERVLFVPAAAPPHKDGGGCAPPAARLAMTELAVEHDIRFVASGLEIERGLVYTRDTLAAVAGRFPDRELFFIMGSDSLLQFDSWHDPDDILALGSLVVAPRPGDDAAAVREAASRWDSGRVMLLDSPLLGISSSLIRARIAGGLPVRYLVPEDVERYIAEHGLYAAS